MGKNSRKSAQSQSNFTVEGETIDILKKTLDLDNIDTENISELIKTLISCVLKLYENSNKTSNSSPNAVETAASAAIAATAAATTATATAATAATAAKEAHCQLRELQDYHDDTRQRFLKGNIILSSRENGNRKATILTTKELGTTTITEHAIQLINRKYGVLIPIDDIQACHVLPNGSILVRIWRRVENSAWSNLIKGIKTGGDKTYNLYCSFHLTHRRSRLLYFLRQAKKQGQIFQFYSDENGNLSFKKTETSKKTTITYHRTDPTSTARPTLTEDELKRSLEST